MKILIVGAGIVGFGLAKHFAGQNHHITVVENDKELCEDINSKLDVFVVEGTGSSPEVLESANIDSSDMVIAVTPSDEVNLLVCNFAMQSGVKKRIARLRSSIYTESNSHLSIESLGVTNVIEPELGVVNKILQYVELPGVLDSSNFKSNSIYLRGYRITEDMPIVNKTLIEIRAMANTSTIRFVVIVRNGKSIPPAGYQQLWPGDEIVAIMPEESFDTFRTLINRKTVKYGKIVVSGGTLTAVHLAEALKPLSEQIILVDSDYEKAHEVAAALNGVQVLYGDIRDTDLLQELNVSHADFFIAASKDSEDNIMSCLLAKAEGARRVIAIRNNDKYDSLFSSLGIDYIIYPQQITLNRIIEQIQTVSFRSYVHLNTVDTEILRLKAQKGGSVSGKSLQQLDSLFKKSIIISCIIRGGSVIIPFGDTVIEEGDEVMIMCPKDHIKLVMRMFNPVSKNPLKSLISRKPKEDL